MSCRKAGKIVYVDKVVLVFSFPIQADAQGCSSSGNTFTKPGGTHWQGIHGINTAECLDVDHLKLEGQEMKGVNTVGAENNFHAHVLGEAQPLQNDMMLVSWGSVGVVQVLDGDNEVKWEAHCEMGHFISQVFLLPTRFSPAP